jgi:hypothetical protein
VKTSRYGETVNWFTELAQWLFQPASSHSRRSPAASDQQEID